MIKSLSFSQDEILQSIIDLHCPEGFECDVTYGNGSFYKNIPEPKYKYDLDPQSSDVVEACSTDIPVDSESLNNIIFDPPFLTYIKQGREHNSIMGKRFSGYWRYDELEKHYQETIESAYCKLKKKGVFIIKCQDIIHNHKMHCTHHNVINWCEKYDFRLLDLFILGAKHRMPVGKNKKQKHARVYHSYFLVFKKM